MAPDERDERPKLSWREIDQRRDGASRRDPSERRPRGPAAEARAREATSQYLKEVDKIFSAKPGGARDEGLAAAVREAHGTPALTDACRRYCDEAGMPEDAALLSYFLDADDPALVAEAIRTLARGHEASSLEIGRGLKSQLRMLEQSADDDVAYEAEELLARL